MCISGYIVQGGCAAAAAAARHSSALRCKPAFWAGENATVIGYQLVCTASLLAQALEQAGQEVDAVLARPGSMCTRGMHNGSLPAH